MSAPTKDQVRAGLTRQQLLDRFNEEVVKPSRRKSRDDPASYYNQVLRIRDEAGRYFWSRARRFPSPREALVIFARARLEQAGIEPAIVRAAVQECASSRSCDDLAAKWVVYPQDPWHGSGQLRPGLREKLRSRYGPESSDRSRSDPPPSTGPSPEPDAPPSEEEEEAERIARYYGEEIRMLEEELRVLERLLGAKKTLLASSRESREKYEAQTRAAKARMRTEQEAREKAEREARERSEREARERAEREREARERRARGKADRGARARPGKEARPPWWATELGITAPYTYEKIKTAYRAKSLLTHPDAGGTNEAFVRVKRAYDEACSRFATRP